MRKVLALTITVTGLRAVKHWRNAIWAGLIDTAVCSQSELDAIITEGWERMSCEQSSWS